MTTQMKALNEYILMVLFVLILKKWGIDEEIQKRELNRWRSLGAWYSLLQIIFMG